MAVQVKQKGKAVKAVVVNLPTGDETVLVHAEYGPQVYQMDGSLCYARQAGFFWQSTNRPYRAGFGRSKAWTQMTTTEKEVAVQVIAKKNRALLELKGPEFFAEASLPSEERRAAALLELGARAGVKPKPTPPKE